MSLGLNTGTKRDRRSEEISEGIASRFFPLEIDNKWVYVFSTRDGERSQIVQVQDIRRLWGHDWAVVAYQVDGSSETFTKLLRTEGDLLLQFSFPRSEQIRLIDFGRTEIDRTDPALGFVDLSDKPVELNELSFERCVLVRSGSVDHEIGIYAPGIGLIESSWLYGRKVLRSARIDGLEIRI